MHKQIGVLLAICVAAACGQRDPQNTVVEASAPPAAATPREAKPEERNILHAVAMYDEFERQAIDARRTKWGKPGYYRMECINALVDRIAGERQSDLAALADAARAVNTPAPDGALDEDYKGYLGLAQQGGETAFSAEQALIHDAVIGELQDFAAALPDSPIRPWADRTILRLKDRLNEINPDVCANGGRPSIQ